nr:MAG TPA: hypothetical protein [Caudoviricetes sp.]
MRVGYVSEVRRRMGSEGLLLVFDAFRCFVVYLR